MWIRKGVGDDTTTVWWGVAGVLTAVLGGAGTKHAARPLQHARQGMNLLRKGAGGKEVKTV